jgi:predicted nucleic acid-binding protein
LIALDTNILVYAESQDDPQGRYEKAIELIALSSAAGSMIPLQAIGEYLNVCRRKKMLDMAAALERAQSYVDLFDTPITAFIDLQQATDWAQTFDLQFFDALIASVAARAGATILLSEDMHDGLKLEGIRIVNPFAAANADFLDDYFGSVL